MARVICLNLLQNWQLCEEYIQSLGEEFLAKLYSENWKERKDTRTAGFFRSLLNDADRVSGYMASKVGCEVTDELERIWKEMVVTYWR